MTDVFSLNDPAQRSEGFAEAKEALSASGLVVMPTDTVYGLAADAFDPVGVRRLLRAKGRGRDMPTPVMVGSVDTMRALATNLSAETRELAAALWPGALTIICRQQPSLRWDLGDSRGTVALRVPDHKDALDLLLDNGPLAVSSANVTGRPPATTVEEAQEMLKDAIDVYLDAGPTPGPTPSTIVDATGDTLRVVRVGAISLERLREIVTTVQGPEGMDEPEAFESEEDFEVFASPGDEGPDDLGPVPHGSTVAQAEHSDGEDDSAPTIPNQADSTPERD